jgi:hypothetical protein
MYQISAGHTVALTDKCVHVSNKYVLIQTNDLNIFLLRYLCQWWSGTVLGKSITTLNIKLDTFQKLK